MLKRILNKDQINKILEKPKLFIVMTMLVFYFIGVAVCVLISLIPVVGEINFLTDYITMPSFLSIVCGFIMPLIEIQKLVEF